jgi:short-subunit dehydrogenase
MPPKSFRTALITGASAGLGAEYARRLAAAGTDLILVARRLERLEALAAELRAKNGVAVEAVRADLTDAGDLGRVERLVAESATLDLLVNDAGYGGRTGFVKGGTADHIGMVRVHVEATVRLTRAALPGMIGRGRGAVSENLQAEVRSKGIVIQALCPGMTHTEFHAVAGIDESIVPSPFWQTAEKVVRTSLRRLGRGVVCIPGWHNKAIAFLMRCPATAVLVRAAGRSRLARRKAGGD